MLQGASNVPPQRSLGERSKTLGPGFMRGHHHNTVVLLNYQDGKYPKKGDGFICSYKRL